MTGKKKRSKKSRKPKILLSRRKAFVLASLLFLCGAVSIGLSVCLSLPRMTAPIAVRAPDTPVPPAPVPPETAPAETVPAETEEKDQREEPSPEISEPDRLPEAARPQLSPEPHQEAVPLPAKPVVPEKKISAPKPVPIPVPEKKQPERKKTPLAVPVPPAVTPVKPVAKKIVPKEPVTVPEKVTAEPLFVIPEARNHACLVFVFDDAGQNVRQLEKCLDLPFPVTIAVLPGLPHSAECARMVRKSGNQVILHQPMQALNDQVRPGPGAIVPSMSVAQIREMIRKNIAEIGPVSGLNNHEGSRITENEIQIGAVLDEAQAEGVYFLDSRTTAQTRAPQAALERGMAIYERDVFLDNTEKKADILEQLYRGLSVANKQGRVIMIGHVWSADVLPAVLADVYPQLKKKGYRFAFVKE